MKNVPYVILDTNVVVSALLFKGECSFITGLWKNSQIKFLLTRPILDEYIRVLSYPKFSLSEADIEFLIEEEILPYVLVLTGKKKHLFKIPKISDPDDAKFLEAALLGKAHFLVTGDKVLLNLKQIGATQILTPADFKGSL